MAGMTIPVPQLDPAPPVLEKPVFVQTPPPTRPDGTALKLTELAEHAFQMFRIGTFGAAPEVWDSAATAWVPAASPAGQAAKAEALAYDDQSSPPWRGPTMNDPRGRFQVPDPTGFPKYFARTRFVTRDGAAGGQSPDSAEIVFDSLIGSSNIKTEMVPDNPKTATHFKLELRGGGYVQFDAPGEVELHSASGASIRITAAGDIELRPAPGRTIGLGGPTVLI